MSARHLLEKIEAEPVWSPNRGRERKAPRCGPPGRNSAFSPHSFRPPWAKIPIPPAPEAPRTAHQSEGLWLEFKARLGASFPSLHPRSDTAFLSGCPQLWARAGASTFSDDPGRGGRQGGRGNHISFYSPIGEFVAIHPRCRSYVMCHPSSAAKPPINNSSFNSNAFLLTALPQHASSADVFHHSHS